MWGVSLILISHIQATYKWHVCQKLISDIYVACMWLISTKLISHIYVTYMSLVCDLYVKENHLAHLHTKLICGSSFAYKYPTTHIYV